jgi:hypothetical protein
MIVESIVLGITSVVLGSLWVADRVHRREFEDVEAWSLEKERKELRTIAQQARANYDTPAAQRYETRLANTYRINPDR